MITYHVSCRLIKQLGFCQSLCIWFCKSQYQLDEGGLVQQTVVLFRPRQARGGDLVLPDGCSDDELDMPGSRIKFFVRKLVTFVQNIFALGIICPIIHSFKSHFVRQCVVCPRPAVSAVHAHYPVSKIHLFRK